MAHTTESEPMLERYHGNTYAVIVGNVGLVFESDEWNAKREASLTFATYVDRSRSGYGRCAHESVTLYRNGEPIHEYLGTIESEEG